MQLVAIFRFVEVLVDAPQGATLTFSTDLPGNALAIRATANIGATVGRHPYRLSLLGSAKGKLYTLRIAPAYFGAVVSIYAARVYARVLGPAPAQWAWYPVPVLETSPDWQPIKLPIPVTPEDWQQIKLPIPTTPEDWNAIQLPITPTAPDFQAVSLPVKATPVVPDWVSVQVDA